MCLILFRFDPGNPHPLVVAANRDEAYSRPSAAASHWTDEPDIYAGRDLEAKGTWLGTDTSGRFAALTNFREASSGPSSGPSRGELVAGFLQSSHNGLNYLRQLQPQANSYQGFNLIVGDRSRLWYFSNRQQAANPITELSKGCYGLCNGVLDSPWPKVVHGKQQLLGVLQQPSDQWGNQLHRLLLNRQPYPDQTLPQTGVGMEVERVLSPIYIHSEHYGTRTSSVLIFEQQRLQFSEHNYPNGAIHHSESSHKVINTKNNRLLA